MLTLHFIFIVVSLVEPSPAPIDACTSRIPESVRQIVARNYSGYRVVRASDYASEDLMQQANGQANACPGVAAADVDGNGSFDLAFFVTSSSGHTLLLAARAQSKGRWRVAMLYDFGNEGVSRSYVEPIEPDEFTDLFALEKAPNDYTPEPGGVKHLRSSRPGFIAGTMESSGVAFFFTGKRWVHLWLSD